MTLWKRKNYNDSKKTSSGQEMKGGAMPRQRTEDFGDRETILYDTVVADTYHHMFVKTHITYKTKNEP